MLFLQSYRLQLGGHVVLARRADRLRSLAAVVAVLTFIARHRLPYKQMLIVTGVLLGVVLLVMVGEQAQEMQLAHWIPTTTIASLENRIPGWMGLWFSIFPNVQNMVAQALALSLVLGSYGVGAVAGCARAETGGTAVGSRPFELDSFREPGSLGYYRSLGSTRNQLQRL